MASARYPWDFPPSIVPLPPAETLELTEVTSDVEFPPLFRCLDNAYSRPHNSFWNIFKSDAKDEFVGRLTDWHNVDPSSHWIYVRDTRTNEIVAGTQWNFYPTSPFKIHQPVLTAYWLQEGTMIRSFADICLERFFSRRPKYMNRPHLIINWCGTHCEHRRRGAGRLMVEWGCKRADELGLDTFAESPDAGRPLFEAVGFITVDDFYWDADVEKPSKVWEALTRRLEMPLHGYLMWRPPGGKFIEGKTTLPWE